MEYLDYYKGPQLFFHTNRDLPPFNHNYGMHTHEIYEILYLVSGRGKICIEGNEYPLRPSSIYLIRSNEAHYTSITGTEPYERIVLHFFPTILDAFDPEHKLLKAFDEHELGRKNHYRLTENSQIIIETAFHNIIDTQGSSYEKRLSVISNLFSILTEINKLHAKKPESASTVTGNDLISDVIIYVNKHLFDDINVETICRIFFISRSRLNTLFKEATSSTLWKYITTKRLLHARKMLRDNLPAQEVASKCGFKDYSTFFRAYKQYFKVSPQNDSYSSEELT